MLNYYVLDIVDALIFGLSFSKSDVVSLETVSCIQSVIGKYLDSIVENNTLLTSLQDQRAKSGIELIFILFNQGNIHCHSIREFCVHLIFELRSLSTPYRRQILYILSVIIPKIELAKNSIASFWQNNILNDSNNSTTFQNVLNVNLIIDIDSNFLQLNEFCLKLASILDIASWMIQVRCLSEKFETLLINSDLWDSVNIYLNYHVFNFLHDIYVLLIIFMYLLNF